jgi:P27 family predicted phage terminase small subunit
MGQMAGRPNKPMSVKLAEGNRSKVALSKLIPDPQGKGHPHMPPGLSTTEEEMFMDLMGSVPDGILSAADDGIIELYVSAWARLREARLQVAKVGLLVRSPTGPVRNPLLVVINNAAREMRAAGAELGLSPVSRAKLTLSSKSGPDPMDWLIDGIGEFDENDIPTLPEPKKKQGLK